MRKTMPVAQLEAKRIETMKTVNLYPFVDNPCPMDELKESKAYKLWEKSIEKLESLTRDEKDWLAEKFNEQAFYTVGNGISNMGWRLIFPTAKKYLVQDDYDCRKYRIYYGFDKTSVRVATGNKRGEIIEYKRQK